MEVPDAPINPPDAPINPPDAPINSPENAREKEPLTDLQVELLSFISSNPSASYDESAKMVQKDRSTIMRNMGMLKEKGILKRGG